MAQDMTSSAKLAAQVVSDRSKCLYASQYCEENVWQLCKLLHDNNVPLQHVHVVFVSNKQQACCIWEQRASSDEHQGLVVWDYHVLLLSTAEQLVFDLDTKLGFPCAADEYFARAFGLSGQVKPEFRALFRLVPAREYLDKFASDRSHMLQEDGEYMATPPSWDCIRTEESTMNLPQFMRVTEPVDGVKSETLDLEALTALVGSGKST